MSFLDKISAGLLCMVFATGISPTIILNPNKISEIDSLDVDIFIKERLKNYINERENKFSFEIVEQEFSHYQRAIIHVMEDAGCQVIIKRNNQ